MAEGILVSALSLFAAFGLLPAVYFILREREVPLERGWRLKGGAAVLLGLILLSLGLLFLLNVLAQDVSLLLALTALLIVSPLAILQFDKRRRK